MARASKVNQLEKLERMRKNGEVSFEEYRLMKDEILYGVRAARDPVPATPTRTNYIFIEGKRRNGCFTFIGKAFFWYVVAMIAVWVLVTIFNPGNSSADKEGVAAEKEMPAPLENNTGQPPAAKQQSKPNTKDIKDTLF